MSIVDPTSTKWTKEEEEETTLVLSKVGFCFQNVRPEKYPLTGQVYEAWAGATKLLSVELVLCNKAGQVYLVRRLSLEKRPTEPYPGKLHCPGSTVTPYETTDEALQRLQIQELGGVEIKYLRFVDKVDFNLPPRAPYVGLVYYAETGTDPINPHGQFYPYDWALQSDELLVPHREQIIPLALASR